jgi:hypothetical protein
MAQVWPYESFYSYNDNFFSLETAARALRNSAVLGVPFFILKKRTVGSASARARHDGETAVAYGGKPDHYEIPRCYIGE